MKETLLSAEEEEIKKRGNRIMAGALALAVPFVAGKFIWDYQKGQELDDRIREIRVLEAEAASQKDDPAYVQCTVKTGIAGCMDETADSFKDIVENRMKNRLYEDGSMLKPTDPYYKKIKIIRPEDELPDIHRAAIDLVLDERRDCLTLVTSCLKSNK